MHERIRLGITPVASPLEVGADEAAALMSRLRERFAGWYRLETFSPAEPVTDPTSAMQAGRQFYDQRVDAICVVAASWFEDYLVLDMLEECGVPVIVWARPGMETGSLCGTQQLAFVLRQLGQPHCPIYDPVDSADALDRASDYALSAALCHSLRRARMGYLGHRVEGMTETTVHELALKKTFGPRVVSLDSSVFLEKAGQVDPESVVAMWRDLKTRVGQVAATDEAGIRSLQVYTALKNAIEDAGLSAVAVGCYPHLMGQVCLAASLLGEEGIPIACEGDINGALGMLILTGLTGQPVHNTDLLDPIPSENAIVFTHCGSGGFSLACSPSEVTLGPVRLMDRGLCCLFPARPGPVTLLNVVPTMGGYRLGTLYGQAVETDMVFPGNPLRVQFETPYRDILDWIVREGLGHHWMAAYGDLQRPIHDLATLVGCEHVSVTGKPSMS